MRATHLLHTPSGDATCFWCGSCASMDYRPPNGFVGWSDVAAPNSRSICAGCLDALDERRPVAHKDKPQKTRNYSWLVTQDGMTPLTKADKATITDTLLSPPPYPWALCLADSGQRHLLYRTPVNQGNTGMMVVLLETDLIAYTPDSLRQCLSLSRLVVGLVGHRNSRSPLSIAAAGDGELADQWAAMLAYPLSDLALWLTPSQQECRGQLDGPLQQGELFRD